MRLGHQFRAGKAAEAETGMRVAEFVRCRISRAKHYYRDTMTSTDDNALQLVINVNVRITP